MSRRPRAQLERLRCLEVVQLAGSRVGPTRMILSNVLHYQAVGRLSGLQRSSGAESGRRGAGRNPKPQARCTPTPPVREGSGEAGVSGAREWIRFSMGPERRRRWV